MNGDALEDILDMASEVSGIIPGLAVEHNDLVIAQKVAPSAKAAAAFFQTKDGIDAIRHLDDFLTFFQTKPGLDAIRHVRSVLDAYQDATKE